MLTTPHLYTWFDFNGDRFVEQDSLDDIAGCVETVLRYQPGIRLLHPEFGYPDQTFAQGGPDLDLLRDSLEQFEPRASAVVEDASGDLIRAGTIDDAVRVIRIALED